MTFTTSLKEEMSKTDFSIVEAQNELISFLNCLGKFSKDELIITMENASVARRIYKEIKAIYKVTIITACDTEAVIFMEKSCR